MTKHSWFYGGQLHWNTHYVHTWPKSELVQLTPLQWAVRWTGLEHALHSPRLFNRRLRRAVERFGIEQVVSTLQDMIENPRSFMLPDKDGRERDQRDGFDPFRLHGQRVMETLWTMHPKLPEFITLMEKVVDVAPFQAVCGIKYLVTADSAHLASESLRAIFYRYVGDEERLFGFEGFGQTDGNFLAGEAVGLIAKLEGRRALPFLEEVLDGPFPQRVKESVLAALGKMDKVYSVRVLERLLPIPELEKSAIGRLRKSKLRLAERILADRSP